MENAQQYAQPSTAPVQDSNLVFWTYKTWKNMPHLYQLPTQERKEETHFNASDVIYEELIQI
eukprot:9928996-Ditylum_brightwellii.AAC.1